MLDTVIRAYKGALRSPLRTALVVALLAIGLSFALTSVALALAAEDELDKLKATTGVEATISVNPGQFQAAIQEQLEQAQEEGVDIDIGEIAAQVESLTSDDVDGIEALPYVRNAQGISTSNVEYGIPGQEEEDDSTDDATTSEPALDPQGQLVPGGRFNVTPPGATITGVDDPAFLNDFQEGTKVLAEGEFFTEDVGGENVVVIDQNTATLEELSIGDTITLTAVSFGPGRDQEDEEEEDAAAPEIDAKIVAIYQDLETSEQGGFGFTIKQWYAPLSVVGQLQDEEQAGTLSSISLVVGSVDDFAPLREDLEEILDPDLFALTTSEDAFADISDPIETMRNTSIVVMVVGLAVVGLIMVMLMVLVMRGRLREIGILKAIGAKSRQVILQFALETVGVAVIAVAIAVPSVFAINTFLPDLIRPEAEAAAAEEEASLQPGGGGPGGGGPGGGFARFGGPLSVGDPVRTEEIEAALNEIDASVGTEVIAVGAAMAVGLGLVGSLVTMFAVLRLRPAEVLRLEA